MSCCGGTNGTAVNTFKGTVIVYKNEEKCGVTVERIQAIDRAVTAEYSRTRHPHLLTLNSELVKLARAFDRTDVCQMLQQIEEWERVYVSG